MLHNYLIVIEHNEYGDPENSVISLDHRLIFLIETV